MSSLIRRIQIRLMQERGVTRIPVKDDNHGKPVTYLYPLYPGQTVRPANWDKL